MPEASRGVKLVAVAVVLLRLGTATRVRFKQSPTNLEPSFDSLRNQNAGSLQLSSVPRPAIANHCTGAVYWIALANQRHDTSAFSRTLRAAATRHYNEFTIARHIPSSQPVCGPASHLRSRPQLLERLSHRSLYSHPLRLATRDEKSIYHVASSQHGHTIRPPITRPRRTIIRPSHPQERHRWPCTEEGKMDRGWRAGAHRENSRRQQISYQVLSKRQPRPYQLSQDIDRR